MGTIRGHRVLMLFTMGLPICFPAGQGWRSAGWSRTGSVFRPLTFFVGRASSLIG